MQHLAEKEQIRGCQLIHYSGYAEGVQAPLRFVLFYPDGVCMTPSRSTSYISSASWAATSSACSLPGGAFKQIHLIWSGSWLCDVFDVWV